MQRSKKKQVDSLEVLLHRMMNRIRKSLELPAILAGTVAELRGFLESDRVKVYRFDADGSGEVVAESVDLKRLPSLLGQHFPADDIPESARELFLLARQRSIVDVKGQQIGISPLDCPETGDAIASNDLRFRPVDPCHAEYLTAMGVASSLVVPILYRDELWGLLVSHHSTPRQVSDRELQVAQLVADQLSIAIAQSTLLEQTRAQAFQEATINRVAKLLHSMTEMQLQQALELTINSLKGYSGRIYVFPKKAGERGQLLACGDCSADQPFEESPNWETWLNTQPKEGEVSPVWAISDLQQVEVPEEFNNYFLTAGIRGLLVIRLQYRTEVLGYLSIFRREIDIEKLWARRTDKDDPRNQLPIQSFETWREFKQGQPQEWTAEEIELAIGLGNHFAMAIHQYELYQQVRALNDVLQRDIERRKQAEKEICALNAELEQRVQIRTAELQSVNTELVREISDRKKAQISLKRLSRQHELILNSAGEGIYGIDELGKITFVNPAAAKMLGYSVGELSNRDMQTLVKHSRWDGALYVWSENPIHATLETGERQHISDDIFYRRDGTKFPVEYVSTPIQEQNKIVGAVVIFKDITERRIVERMKDEFVSVVSHELRTPLTSIRSALGLLARGSLDNQPSKRSRMLEIAFDNTNRLVRLINDILDIERINSGKVTMEKQMCNAGELMTQAVDEMRAMAEKVEMKLELTPISIQLLADPDRIVQTLTNLLSNAIKFSDPGSTIWLSAEYQKVETTNPYILFKIKDRGRGIPENKLETIFDRFQQVDASISRHQGGTGLGLAICRSIVEQHQGKIWAESSLGQGSTFYFTLPL